MGCSPKDLPKAMNEWEKWRERVRNIRASGTTWWWRWWWHHFYNYCLCPVDWGCRIHQLLLCRGVRPTPANECSGYDTKQSDGKVPVMLELWGMQSTSLLLLFPGPLWPGMVAADKGPIYGLNRTKLHTYAKLNYLSIGQILMLNWIVWIRTVWINWIAWNRNVFHIETELIWNCFDT